MDAKNSSVVSLVAQATQKYGRTREKLMPILQFICQEHHYLSLELMREVATQLDISAAEVHGMASFYSFLPTEERGKYTIKVCRTISCDMKNKNSIINTLRDFLKIGVGETTADKKFSLVETNCIGWCDKAPAMLINDEPYTSLTPVKVKEILESYVSDKPIKDLGLYQPQL